MTMPEAPVHEDHGIVFGKYDVGFTRKIATVNPESKSKTMQQRSNHQFRTSVFTFDASHDPAPSFRVNDVGVQRRVRKRRNLYTFVVVSSQESLNILAAHSPNSQKCAGS